jgi:putative chitinase
MISVASLVAAGIGPTQARAFEAPLQQACEQFDISTLNRRAAFVAQCAHESALFVHLEEDLFYRDPARVMRIFPRTVTSLVQAATLIGNPQGLANTVYANRNGNGPYASGDGWLFHGRGLLQLTGRANYAAAAQDLGEPFLEHPEYVGEPPDACLTAAWYWTRARCNAMADGSDIDAITRAINGPAMDGADKRRDLYRRALQAFR